MRVLAELYDSNLHDYAFEILHITHGFTLPIKLKSFLKKIPNIKKAETIILDGVKKLGKDKILDIFDTIEKEYSKEADASIDTIFRKFAYPLLFAAVLFMATLGTKSFKDMKDRIEKQQDTRIEQIMNMD